MLYVDILLTLSCEYAEDLYRFIKLRLQLKLHRHYDPIIQNTYKEILFQVRDLRQLYSNNQPLHANDSRGY